MYSSNATDTPALVPTVVKLVRFNLYDILYFVLGFIGIKNFALSTDIPVPPHVTCAQRALQNVAPVFVSQDIEYLNTRFPTHSVESANCHDEVQTFVPVEYIDTQNFASSTAA